MSWNLAFSARPGFLPASQMTSSVRLFRVLSGANIHTSLSPSLAADEASQLLGWALQAHRVLYPIQAHGCLRVHGLQRFRGWTALRVLGALQQAWGLSHHHVQQRSSPVGQVLFPPFVAVSHSVIADWRLVLVVHWRHLGGGHTRKVFSLGTYVRWWDQLETGLVVDSLRN